MYIEHPFSEHIIGWNMPGYADDPIYSTTPEFGMSIALRCGLLWFFMVEVR